MIVTDELKAQRRANKVHQVLVRLGGAASFDRLKRQLNSTQPAALSSALSLLEEEGRVAILLHGMRAYYVLSERLEEWG